MSLDTSMYRQTHQGEEKAMVGSTYGTCIPMIPILRPLGIWTCTQCQTADLLPSLEFSNNPQCSAWGRGSSVGCSGAFSSLGSGYPNGRWSQGGSGERKM